MDREKLVAILDEHEKWLTGEGGKRADLQGADLQGADLQWANLQGAYLQGANLQGAYLQWADLQGEELPPPTMLLLCNWGEVSPILTTELMRYDASNHPDSSKFSEWAKGGDCPYQKGFQRCANFKEQRDLWKAGKSKSARELVLMLFTEKNIKYSEGI